MRGGAAVRSRRVAGAQRLARRVHPRAVHAGAARAHLHRDQHRHRPEQEHHPPAARSAAATRRWSSSTRARPRYRLGLKVFRLGSVVSKSMELSTQADPLLEDLAEETGETAFLVVADGDEALCAAALRRRAATCASSFSRWASVRPSTAGRRRGCCSPTCRAQRWEEIVAGHVARDDRALPGLRGGARARPARDPRAGLRGEPGGRHAARLCRGRAGARRHRRRSWPR